MSDTDIVAGIQNARDALEGESSIEGVCRSAVDALDDLFAFDACDCLRNTEGRFERLAGSDPESEGKTNGPRIAVTCAHAAYESQNPILVSDTTEESRFEFDTDYRSILAFPLDEHGVIQLAAAETGAFNDRDLALADVFGGFVAQKLDDVEFAWVGETDLVTETVSVGGMAGPHGGYLDELGLELDDESPVEPTVQTARTDQQTVVDNTATNISREAWRGSALQRGFQSVLSTPLQYQETSQGVLSVYSPRNRRSPGICRPSSRNWVIWSPTPSSPPSANRRSSRIR